MKENWEGEKVASFSLNTRSSNSTGCSYSSGLLWINDRIPQRRGPKDFSLSLMEFTFMYMKKTNLAMDLMLRKVFQPQQEGRWGVRGESFESSKKKKETNEILLLLPKASCKLHPSIFICIVYELPIYLFVTAASLLLWTRGNKMIIYSLLTVCLTGPER